jgi:exodeoxyribonuclease-1
MSTSFFFYDLETTGISARASRIMQFAGQRTDMDMNLIGEPVDLLIKLSPDVLPDPNAIMITGITPQHTLDDGLTEAEFLKYFYEQVVLPDTIFIGFNSVRFDDEFMRYLNYRNFYDAYEWQWKNGCTRWDLLDVVRMTRALRPDGIEWPFNTENKPTNRLELLTKLNKLDHAHAHDALNDVLATIAVARLIKQKQPDLFSYLLNNKNKQQIKLLVEKATPFVYTSGHYPSRYLHTSVAVQIAKHLQQDAGLVYDLRYDPSPYLNMDVDELIECWQYTKDPQALHLPVKTLKYNRCPAVAPLGVIKQEATQQRLDLNLDDITSNLNLLKRHQKEFAAKLAETVDKMDKSRALQQQAVPDSQFTVDERLYDGFINKTDQLTMAKLRGLSPADITTDSLRFKDDRLNDLLPLYKARNYPKSLSSEEREAWEKFISEKLLGGGKISLLAKYFERLRELSDERPSKEKGFLIEELKLYGESIIPGDEAE